jgi:hypothetical protein
MAIFEPYGSKLYTSWQINQILYPNYKVWGQYDKYNAWYRTDIEQKQQNHDTS